MLDEKIKENIALIYGDFNYVKKKKKDYIIEDKTNYLEKSCKFGHLKIAKYFLESYLEKNYFVLDKLFRICCEYGHLQIAKYFLVK